MICLSPNAKAWKLKHALLQKEPRRSANIVEHQVPLGPFI